MNIPKHIETLASQLKINISRLTKDTDENKLDTYIEKLEEAVEQKDREKYRHLHAQIQILVWAINNNLAPGEYPIEMDIAEWEEDGFRPLKLSEYVTHDQLSYGDYAMSSLYNKSNVLWLEQECSSCEGGSMHFDQGDYVYNTEVVTLTGGYGSVQAFVHPDSALVENVHGLDDYPILCEDFDSYMRCEWEGEAWENYLSDYIKSDMKRYITEKFEGVLPCSEELLEDILEENDIYELWQELDTTGGSIFEENMEFTYQQDKVQEFAEHWFEGVLPKELDKLQKA